MSHYYHLKDYVGEVTKYPFQVVVIGEDNVGKSSLIDCFVSDIAMKESIGTTFAKTYISRVIDSEHTEETCVVIYEGIPSSFSTQSQHQSTLSGALLCFHDLQSFKFVSQILESPPCSSIALVYLKSDLLPLSDAPFREEVKAACSQHNVRVFSTSAMKKIGCEAVFLYLASKIFDHERKLSESHVALNLDSEGLLVPKEDVRWRHLPKGTLTPEVCSDERVLKSLFDSLDTDRSGYICSAEIDALKAHLSLFDSEFDSALRSISPKCCSAEAKLDFSEFVLVLLRFSQL
eukprot:TRINITY_DN22956_c0_g1_i1.p1 TRINITY_DN22956_c0_g1~~TRINITY_DN22956_c0_g1_i1.p1  ORF type:complete len:313 (+),score=47.60 TRINITY_DN22956_c0_g1_i1:71-940(+)